MMENYDWITSNLTDEIEAGCNKKIKKREEKDIDTNIIPLNISVKNIQNSKRKFNVSLKFSFEQKDDFIEWKIKLKNSYNVSPNDNKTINEDFELDGEKSKTSI